MIEDDELVGVDHVNEEELIPLRLEEREHLGMSEGGNGEIEPPGQDALLLRPRDEMRNVARKKLFVEITP